MPSSTAYPHRRGTSPGSLGKASNKQTKQEGDDKEQSGFHSAGKKRINRIYRALILSTTYLLPVTVLSLACLNIELPLLDKSFLKFFGVKDDLAPQLLLLLFLFLKEDCILTVDDCSTRILKQ